MIGGEAIFNGGETFLWWEGGGGGELLLELGNFQGIPPLYEEIKRKS